MNCFRWSINLMLFQMYSNLVLKKRNLMGKAYGVRSTCTATNLCSANWFFCCCANHIKFLLESGIDIDLNESTKSYSKTSPLHDAVWKNAFEIVLLLLAAGADVNVVDSNIATPLHYACKKSMTTNIIDLLLSHGANVCANDRLILTGVDLMTRSTTYIYFAARSAT